MTAIAPSVLTTAASSGLASKASANAGNQLTENDFLSLLTAQLKNQDPTSPMDNAQMAAQLAQFSTVSGISEMNTTLSSMASQMGTQTDLLKSIAASTIAKPASSKA
jgi:flagellar basal-body rod modification protein FlgD